MIKKILIITIIILVFRTIIYYLSQNEKDTNSKYSNCELGDLVGDDVEKITYQKFNIDYHTRDFTKIRIKNYAKECIDDGVKTQYQMDCCMSIKMYPEN